MKSALLLLLPVILGAVAAESIRETETMDPNYLIDVMESSGSLPDDEDIDDPDYYDDLDLESVEEGSGSGDSDEFEDDLESTMDTPTTTMGNLIPEDTFRERKVDVVELGNEIVPEDKELIELEPSNEVSMASTAHSFFSKTEVIIALVAGALVGLLFAIFIIVLLIMRIRRNKGDLPYDPVKKPIYKKAPTVEA